MAALQKTMEPQEVDNSPGPGLGVRQAKEQAVKKVCGWSVQNKMSPGLHDCRHSMKDSHIVQL